MSNINQLPLWCRQCDEPYTALDENGVCDNCGTPNVLERHVFGIVIPIDAYSKEQARTEITALVENLVFLGLLPDDTVVGE